MHNLSFKPASKLGKMNLQNWLFNRKVTIDIYSDVSIFDFQILSFCQNFPAKTLATKRERQDGKRTDDSLLYSFSRKDINALEIGKTLNRS